VTAEVHSRLVVLKALAGPIVWAGHFFFLYLLEAFLCTADAAYIGVVRWTGIAATAAALGLLALLVLSSGRASNGSIVNTARDDPMAFAVPLTLLSMVAVAWASMPLFLLPACLSAYQAMPGG
jgi:hypothetical protein